MESVLVWNGTVDGKEQTRAEGVAFTYKNIQYVFKDGSVISMIVLCVIFSCISSSYFVT